MGIKTLLAMAAAAIGGIYLTSDEGKKAREALREKKSIFQPIIQDLTKQANDILEGTQKLNSEEVRENIDKLVNEAKKILIDIDLDKTTESIKNAIRVANKKIRDASNEPHKIKKVTTKAKNNKPKTVVKKAPPKKKNVKNKTITIS